MNETQAPRPEEIAAEHDKAKETAAEQVNQKRGLLRQDIAHTNAGVSPEALALYSELQNQQLLEACNIEPEPIDRLSLKLVLVEIQTMLDAGLPESKVLKIIPKKLNHCISKAREQALDTDFEASQNTIAQKVMRNETSQNSVAQRKENTDTQAQKIETQAETIASQQALVDNFLKTKITARNLNSYRAETIGFLHSELPEADFDRNAEYAKQIFDQHEATLKSIEGVFSPEEVETLFAGSLVANVTLNLAGNSSADIYADVFDRIEQSSLPPERKEALRKGAFNVLGQVDRDINTGTDVQKAALAMQIDPDTGKEVPMHTSDNKAAIVPGVTTYTETGKEVILEASINGHLRKIDVTGMGAEDVGLITEALGYWVATESFGATGFVEDIYKIDFNVLSDSSFDPLSLIDIRQKLSYMVGGFEGYDGDIFDPREKKGLIQAQMRVLSQDDSATGWENSRSDTLESVKLLGLENSEVLKEFGSFTQAHYLTGILNFESVRDHLHGRFPQFVGKAE